MAAWSELHPALGILLEVSVRSLVLLVLTGLLALALQRSSSAARCVLWQFVVAGLLALPVLTPALPTWRLPILPATQAGPPLAPGPKTGLAEPGPGSAPETARRENPLTPAPPSVRRAPIGTGEAPESRHTASALWLMQAGALWLLGLGFLLAHMLIGFQKAHQVVKRCRVAVEPGLLSALEEACTTLDVRQRVTVLVGPQDGVPAVPMTTGLFRPAVLLPHGAPEWPGDRCRVVMLHELAHVRRRDWLWHLLAGFACILYWWNPIVWLLARRLRRDTEGACDDLVLLAGVRPSDYAGHLLNIVRSLCGRPRLVPNAVPVARRPDIESRLRLILAVDQPRGAPGKQAQFRSLGVSLLVLAPVAWVSPTARTAPLPHPPGAASPQSSTPSPDRTRGAITGHLGNPQGKPASAPGVGPVMAGDRAARKDQPVWGREVDGLQAGIQVSAGNPPYSPGDTVTFEISVRNVGQKGVTFSHLTEPHNRGTREWTAILREANEAMRRYLWSTDREDRRGTEIARELWGPAILALNPARVYDDRVNVAIVLKENADVEEGLYVALPISSYALDGRRFTSFVRLSEANNGTLGELYRYTIKKRQPEPESADRKAPAPSIYVCPRCSTQTDAAGDCTRCRVAFELARYGCDRCGVGRLRPGKCPRCGAWLKRKGVGLGARVASPLWDNQRHLRLTFRGLDLTSAPVTTDTSALGDLFEDRPPGSLSYHLRPEVVRVTEPGSLPVGVVYYLPEKDLFYVQYDPLGASTLHYYGPFKGDPYRRLDLSRPERNGRAVTGGPADVRNQGVWGEIIEGVRCRLRADKRVWRVGESPTFQVELRNDGARTLMLNAWRPGKGARIAARVKVVVDGEWCELLRDEPPVESAAFGPGKQWSDIRFSLAEYGIDGARSVNTLKLERELRPIRLGPGRHTVQVRFDLQWAANGGITGPEVASGPVEIEVVSAR